MSTDCYNIQASNLQDKYWANSDVGQGPTGSCVVGYEWDGVLQGDADTPAGRQQGDMRQTIEERRRVGGEWTRIWVVRLKAANRVQNGKLWI